MHRLWCSRVFADYNHTNKKIGVLRTPIFYMYAPVILLKHTWVFSHKKQSVVWYNINYTHNNPPYLYNSIFNIYYHFSFFLCILECKFCAALGLVFKQSSFTVPSTRRSVIFIIAANTIITSINHFVVQFHIYRVIIQKPVFARLSSLIPE